MSGPACWHCCSRPSPQRARQGSGGYILRTAAEGADLAGLRADLRFLRRLWDSVSRHPLGVPGERLLHADLPLHLRVARDLASPSLERILVDDHAAFIALRSFCGDYQPELIDRLQFHGAVGPLFELYGVEAEIRRALAPRVELASGGYLVIEQTEAMTTVDVNSGSFVGRRNPEETILRTNLEAAATLARQLRLRGLGGIIMVDFIDMAEPGHRRQLVQALQEALQADPVRTTCHGMSELGLVALTRKRSGESLQHLLCVDCPVCRGTGALKSARTVCCEIFREISRARGARRGGGVACAGLAASGKPAAGRGGCDPGGSGDLRRPENSRAGRTHVRPGTLRHSGNLKFVMAALVGCRDESSDTH